MIKESTKMPILENSISIRSLMMLVSLTNNLPPIDTLLDLRLHRMNDLIDFKEDAKITNIINNDLKAIDSLLTIHSQLLK